MIRIIQMITLQLVNNTDIEVRCLSFTSKAQHLHTSVQQLGTCTFKVALKRGHQTAKNKQRAVVKLLHRRRSAWCRSKSQASVCWCGCFFKVSKENNTKQNVLQDFHEQGKGSDVRFDYCWNITSSISDYYVLAFLTLR